MTLSIPPCNLGGDHKLDGFGSFCWRCGLIVARNKHGKKRRATKNAARWVQFCIRRDGPRCRYCRAEFDTETPPTLDHVVPLSRGGTNETTNLVAACQPCNAAKGADLWPLPPLAEGAG